MSKPELWQIVAYHNNKHIDDVAELSRKEGIAAVGWYDAGDLKNIDLADRKEKEKIVKLLKKNGYKSYKTAVSKGLIPFKDKLKRGDWVILYKKGQNTIACIGKIIGNYKFDNTNAIGRESTGGAGCPVVRNGQLTDFGYPHQRKVKWLETPINFNRTLLPKKFKGVGSQGTIHKVHGGSVKELLQTLKTIHPEHKKIGGGSVDEATIKEYLGKFIGKNLGDIEAGLKLIKREYNLDSGIVDFLAKDSKGIDVLIEVKTTANSGTVGQIQGYMAGKPNVRGIIVANAFKDNCKNALRESKSNISCFSCREAIVFKKSL